MKPLNDYPEPDLKHVYRILQGQLQNHPDLIDNQLLEDLQQLLQRLAADQGVDPTYHPAWAAWLRGEPTPPPRTGPTLKLVED